MPELPDLEVFAKNLTKEFKGKKLKSFKLVNKKKIKTPEKKFKNALQGQAITNVHREGKELRFVFKNGNILGLHLMLHGQLYKFDGKNDKKFTIAELLFENKTGLAITDFQGNARVSLNPEPPEAPDALSKEVNYKFLKNAFDSKAVVKNILMDQHVIRGIGNAYADEILWHVKISPLSIANKLPDAKIKLLATRIKKVLKDAEKKILKEHPDIISGEIRDFLAVHNSRKKESPTGYAIKSTSLNSRKTYYTEEQELFD